MWGVRLLVAREARSYRGVGSCGVSLAGRARGALLQRCRFVWVSVVCRAAVWRGRGA